MPNGLCPKCGGPLDRLPARYCKACHAAYMRAWRNEHPLDAEQNRRQTARAYARVYLLRGKITRKPCENCGAEDAQMHHPDYSKPLWVIWLCRPCHLAEHGK